MSNFVLPSGVVLPYASSNTPEGFLACNGQAVSRTTYASLFAVLGSSHGEGDGSTTFNLPDYRGRFLRGHDNGAGRDPDAGSRTAMNTGGDSGDSVGSVQDEATAPNGLGGTTDTEPAHSHNTQGLSNRGFVAGPSVIASSTFDTVYQSGTAGDHDHSLNVTSSDSETRPINASVNYIIKT